VVAGRGGTT